MPCGMRQQVSMARETSATMRSVGVTAGRLCSCGATSSKLNCVVEVVVPGVAASGLLAFCAPAGKQHSRQRTNSSNGAGHPRRPASDHSSSKARCRSPLAPGAHSTARITATTASGPYRRPASSNPREIGASRAPSAGVDGQSVATLVLSDIEGVVNAKSGPPQAEARNRAPATSGLARRLGLGHVDDHCVMRPQRRRKRPDLGRGAHRPVMWEVRG